MPLRPTDLPARRRRLLPAALALSLIAGAAGCGYRFTPRGGELPEGVRALQVPIFRNLTAEPGIEGIFTDALRQELARAGRLGGEGADAVALGAVTEVRDGAAIYLNSPDGGGGLASIRVEAVATLRLERAGRTLAEVTVRGDEDYIPGADSPSILEDEASRRMALRRLSQSLMRQAVERLASGF